MEIQTGNSAGLHQAPGQRYVERERESGAASTWASRVRPALAPAPPYIGVGGGLGQPQPLGAAAKRGERGANLAPKSPLGFPL